MQLPGEFSPFIDKKVVFCLVVGGVTPPAPLSGPTTKKTTFFLCVSSLTCSIFFAVLPYKFAGKRIFCQTNSQGPEPVFFRPLSAGAARKKYQEPEPLEKKVRAGAAKKFAGSPALQYKN